MMTIRQIDRFWSNRNYARLAHELIHARAEAAFGVEGLERPCNVAALAMIRMDELSQSSLPLYGTLLRTVLVAQERDGGWGDPAATALCLRALMLGSGEGAAVERGLAYLAALQREEGIWPNGPMRRMSGDPSASLFVLYQLCDNPSFLAAVRANDALEWFVRNEAILSRECCELWERTKLRCRPLAPKSVQRSLFAGCGVEWQ